MPEPNWTASYNFAGNPASNGFTQVLYQNPAVTFITSGNPISRRIEINAANGDCVFETSSVPALTFSNGATIELMLNVANSGNAGYELTFLDAAVLIQVSLNSLQVTLASDTGQQDVIVPTGNNNADILWRATVDTQRQLRVYRAGVLVAGPIAVPAAIKPFQRVLFWVEAGCFAVIRKMAFYSGGAVEPG